MKYYYTTQEARKIMENDDLLLRLEKNHARALDRGINENQDKAYCKKWNKRVKELGISFDKNDK